MLLRAFGAATLCSLKRRYEKLLISPTALPTVSRLAGLRRTRLDPTSCQSKRQRRAVARLRKPWLRPNCVKNAYGLTAVIEESRAAELCAMPEKAEVA
jgi:hypothetical protein